eukprot:TRINITY_DN70872_c0_g1_i1.p1 TRINITY_DN70872_c0_g1~~TRINITY_DN70872_c0_g1_i1.p1  ORF type:complete len:357 (+),score=129.12 TRINITY_DN70872_c0_g1_i1:104-1072(+)
MAAPKVDCMRLSNGVEIPSLGYGCAFGNWTDPDGFPGFMPDEAWVALPMAIKVGYRHFDTARAYATERHLGDVLGRHFQDGTLKRSDVFVTTKVMHPNAPPHIAISHLNTFDPDEPGLDVGQKVTDDFLHSLEKLGLGYVDLLLIHWPGKHGSKDKALNRARRSIAWRSLEALYKKKVARAIGVCNFTRDHMEELLADGAEIVPMVNQVEVHPYCSQKELVDYLQSKGVVTEAYSPFASGAGGLLKDPVLTEIAGRVGKNTGQVIERWLIQRGIIPLGKSLSESRAASNLNVFDFTLTPQDMAKIDGLDKNMRTCPDPAGIP